MFYVFLKTHSTVVVDQENFPSIKTWNFYCYCIPMRNYFFRPDEWPRKFWLVHKSRSNPFFISVDNWTKPWNLACRLFVIVPSEFFNNDIIYDHLLTFMHRLWHLCCCLSKKKTHSGWCAQLWRILCLRHIIPILWLVFRSDRGMLILGSVVSFLFLLFFFIAIYTLKSINLNSHHDITTGLF